MSRTQGNRIIIGVYQNSEYCTLMVNAVLTKYNIYHSDDMPTDVTKKGFSPEDFRKAQKLYEFIDSSYGVKEVTVRRFEVGVTKGEAFAWADVIPPIVEHLKEYILAMYPELAANPWNVSIIDERARQKQHSDFGRRNVGEDGSESDELVPVTLDFFGINAVGDQIA